MKNRHSNDNLEDLFRNSFNDQNKTNESEGWNIPSAQVWGQIESGLKEDKQPERKLLYWYWGATAASFLLLISVIQLYQYAKQIDNLSTQLHKNEQVVKNIQSQLRTLEQTHDSKTIANSLEKKSINTTKKSISQSSNITKRNIVFNNAQPSKTFFHQQAIPLSPSSNSSLEKVIKNGSPLASNRLPTPVGKVKTPLSQPDQVVTQKALSNPLKTLPKLTPLLNVPQQSIEVMAPITPTIAQSSNLYVGVEYAPTWTSIKRNISNNFPPNFFPAFEQQENSYAFGLKLGIPINPQWTVETGIQYLQSENTIQHNRAIPFHFLEERLNGQGNYESTFSLQLNSSAGAVETDVLISRNAASMVEEDARLDFDIQFSNRLTYVELPIILKRQLSHGRLGFNVKAGLVNRFLIQKSFDFQHIDIADERFQFQPRRVREQPKGRQGPSSYTANYLLGFGLAYKILPKMEVYVEPTFSRSIQPIVELGDVRMFSQTSSVNLGVRYTL